MIQILLQNLNSLQIFYVICNTVRYKQTDTKRRSYVNQSFTSIMKPTSNHQMTQSSIFIIQQSHVGFAKSDPFH